MKEISSHILRLTGKAELPAEIEGGHNYRVALDGSITTISETDNENGTWNRLYTFKPIKIELLQPTGEALKLKDTRSMSQLLRARFWKQWNDRPDGLPFDEWYERLMQNLIHRAPEIVEMYYK